MTTAAARAQPPSFPQEEGLVKAVKERFGERVLNAAILRKDRIKVTVDQTIIKEASEFIKWLGFNHIHVVTGTDYPAEKRIEVAYVVGAIDSPELKSMVFMLATNLPRENPKMPTLIPVWPGAEYHEREEHEMLGIDFEGHPNLSLLLLPEDWNDMPPLRKDFKLKKWHEWERAEHGLVKPKEAEQQPTAQPPAAKPTVQLAPQPAQAAKPAEPLPPGVDAKALDGLIKLLNMKGSVEISQATAIIKMRTKQEKPDVEPYIKALEQQGKAKREGGSLVKVA